MRTAQRAESINRELARRGAAVAVFCLSAESSSLADAMNTGALLPDKPLLAFDNNRGRRFSPHKIPSVFIGGEDGRRLREALGRGDGKRNKVRGSVQLAVGVDKRAHAMNVVACREGVDRKLNKEAVVFSAHMDHMGTRLDGDAFNGADDNASGTAGLLEIAEAFATEAPKRSIVFLSVSGEELGLWGSEYFADHATWPLARIVADINIDMIGRSTVLAGENAISVTPSHRHNQYSTLVRNAAHLAPEFELGLTIGDTYYQRSDHYNFARKGIPVVFFCDGEHEDYHKVTDHADKLDYAKMERVTRLAFWTGWMAAEAKHRPKRLGSQAGW